MNYFDFFDNPSSVVQKQYEALRMYYYEKKSAAEVAEKFGYTYRGFTTIITVVNTFVKNGGNLSDYFFIQKKKGRKKSKDIDNTRELIIELRKKNYSVEDIKTVMDSKRINISEKTIYNLLKSEGFQRLPRRRKDDKQSLETPNIPAEKSRRTSLLKEEFKSKAAGIFALLPYIKKYAISDIIEKSGFPGTKQISTTNSILSFVALKAMNIRRYTADDLWCMDKGAGLFAGLNVLPKAAWFTSYSHRVTSEMNLKFLRSLHVLWVKEGLLGDTANMDFTTIPYWGESGHLENNWSGKRGKAMASMLAVLSHDPDSGIIDYGSTNVKHINESAVVLEYLDFYRNNSQETNNLKYLVFDSKFTNYENLNRLNHKEIKFVTIRRRGKNIVSHIDNLPGNLWKKIRVDCAGNKKRSLRVSEEFTQLKGYEGQIRQINITGHGKIKPAVIITNDFDLKLEAIIRKYTRRWLVEKSISEQISFFHINNVSSSMVIKVDFDFVMTILTHNLYRLLAMDLGRYSHLSDQSLYDKFIENTADIKVGNDEIEISLKKKRNLPLLLEVMSNFSRQNYGWLGNKKVIFSGASYS